MPTYDYLCNACGYKFEEFQAMSDEHLIICPQCGEPALKRLISAGAGLLFKGSGFYLTDYKKTASSPALASDHGAKNGSESKPAETTSADSGPKDSTKKDTPKKDTKPKSTSDNA